MIEERPFSTDYLDDVVTLLKSNYNWMSKQSNAVIKKWMRPLYTQPWESKVGFGKDYPYGKVLIANDAVVGYLGAINVKRYVCSQACTITNITTWAVDRSARGGFIPYMEDIFLKSDIVLDLTPNPVSIKIEKKIFGAQEYEDMEFKFAPNQCIDGQHLEIALVDDENQIEDENIRKEYLDHSAFDNIRLLFIGNGNEGGYVFYKVIHRKGIWIRILKVTDIHLFSVYLEEILAYIVDKEKQYICKSPEFVLRGIVNRVRNKNWIEIACDSRFLEREKTEHVPCRSSTFIRLVKDNVGLADARKIDHLYTEYALLNDWS